MAFSSNREDCSLGALADNLPPVVDGPSAVGVVASRKRPTLIEVVFLFAGVVTCVYDIALLRTIGFFVTTITTGFYATTAIGFAPTTAHSATATDLRFAVISNAALAVLGGFTVAGPRRIAGAGIAMLLRGAAGLLPGSAVSRYREEWTGELYDLGSEGAPWWSRVGYILGILLFSAPRLAVGLRLRGERSRA
ncbi:hypothetical protein GA0070558_13432 [Micromonospora haikouensis]|uniref:Uncharacterized protein n=1 Tax=Micromonospora haikouensis TaxID=686309 RepID=A0A1C4Y303_9ACTN|nr:hypothetical protein [Micromonospora haikouensis]SCF15104.1 hypothetical protein GA0070558_13432 [Micromonospora haikouensis]